MLQQSDNTHRSLGKISGLGPDTGARFTAVAQVVHPVSTDSQRQDESAFPFRCSQPTREIHRRSHAGAGLSQVESRRPALSNSSLRTRAIQDLPATSRRFASLKWHFPFFDWLDGLAEN